MSARMFSGLDKVKFHIVLTVMACSAITPVSASSIATTPSLSFLNNKQSSGLAEYSWPTGTAMKSNTPSTGERSFDTQLGDESVLVSTGFKSPLGESLKISMGSALFDNSIAMAAGMQ